MRQGQARFRVFTPFMLADGDLLSLVLKHDPAGGGWVFSDGASTFMRLSYGLDDEALNSATRQRIIGDALTVLGIENRNGELVKPVVHGEFSDTLFTFIQGVLRIADVAQLTRETVRRAFADDLARVVDAVVPERKRIHNWFDPFRDPQGTYRADWRVAGHTPLFIFALGTQNRVKDATIALHQYERWGMKYDSVGVFQDSTAIPAKDIARFGDVATKIFSHLPGNEDRLAAYIQRHLEQSGAQNGS